LGATIAKESNSNLPEETEECPSLGFASVSGDRTMMKGDPQGFERFNFAGDGSVKLGELLQAFEKAEPIEGLGFDFEGNTCIHFASRIWRELDIVESYELGEFLVKNIVKDKNLIDLAKRKAGGIAVVATTLFGPDALRGHIEKVVYSQLNLEGRSLRERDVEVAETLPFDFPQYGLKRGFDQRHLKGVKCTEKMYDVDLVVMGDVMIFLEPTADAAAAGCPAYLLYTTLDSSNRLVKEVIQFEDGVPDDVLTEHHGTMITMGAFKLKDAIKAYHDASVNSKGHNGETVDSLTNNFGDFVANYFHLLGHTSSPEETAVIVASLMMSDPDVAEKLRESSSDSTVTVVANMTNEELVLWTVEQRTSTMYEGSNE
jgi:hypothetical protein